MGCALSVDRDTSKKRRKHKYHRRSRATKRSQHLQRVLKHEPVISRHVMHITTQVTQQDGRVISSHRVKDWKYEVLKPKVGVEGVPKMVAEESASEEREKEPEEQQEPAEGS